MTVCVCFKCGAIKWGAFNACPKCKSRPQSEDDFVISMAMTDHYFDKPTMERMGADIAAGKPPDLDPETRANMLANLRESGVRNMLLNAQLGKKESWWKRIWK